MSHQMISFSFCKLSEQVVKVSSENRKDSLFLPGSCIVFFNLSQPFQNGNLSGALLYGFREPPERFQSGWVSKSPQHLHYTSSFLTQMHLRYRFLFFLAFSLFVLTAAEI